jgi:CRP-like cAMP-binding protein
VTASSRREARTSRSHRPSGRDLWPRPPFAQLSKRELRLLDRLWSEIPVTPGTVLAYEDRRCREFAIIVEGTARVTRDGHEIAFLESGQYFGEIGILRAVPNAVTIVAATTMTIEVMDLREFRTAYTTMSALRAHIDHQIELRTPTWLRPVSSVPAPPPLATPPPEHDGDYTLAS